MKVPKIEPKEEKQEDELGANVKEDLNDTDLEYLFQDVVRTPSLDEELKKDQEKKKDNARYIDMLVRQKNIYQNFMCQKKKKCSFAHNFVLMRHFLFQKFRQKLPSYGMREVNVTFCDSYTIISL